MTNSVSKRVGHEAQIIGRNLNRLRTLYGYSQRQVADQLDTSFQQIQKYEKGQNRIPAEKLHLLKVFFDVPYAAFFEGLEGAAYMQIDKPDYMAPVISEKITGIEDVFWRERIFRAFMILAS